MDLLTNAIESIRVGVEDYQQGDNGRLLAAVRSILAGILLLYKEALRRLSRGDSDEVLLKVKIPPKQSDQGVVEFVGEGRKTVDAQQIRERFEALGIIIDWTRFDRITTVRNEIEHYYTKTNKKALEGLISDAFVLARNFISTQLKEDPLKLLGDETWQAMLEVSEVYEVERGECMRALEDFNLVSNSLSRGVMRLTCPAGSGDLIRPAGRESCYHYDMKLECRGCGEIKRAEDFAPRAVKLALEQEMYLSHKDGGDTPYTTCSECGADAYIMEEECCALCSESAEHTCAHCGSSNPAEELACSPYCGYCDHMMSKDD